MVDAKAIKDKAAKKIASGRSKLSQITAHKHCKMCGVMVDSKADPRICKEQECIDKLARQGKNDKMMRMMFFVFAFFVALPIIAQILQ
jgi:predicted nucleic acid-binding Zn ribbon protein